jgi:cytochrome P450
VEDLCKPYPALTIATVMGAPLEDAERLWEWSNVIQRQFGMKVLEERANIERALTDFYAWAEELLARRRDAPEDDLVSSLIKARFEGDKLDDAELLNLVLNVLVGGVDTTQSQLAQALRLFAEHPDQWELLAREPDRAPQAVEEVVRYEPITPFTARIALEEVSYRGVTFPEGTVVLVCAHTGNRDGESDGFDITEQRTGKPLTFGAGPHYCLGANLARAELQEALRFLAPRLPGLELDGDPVYGTIDGIYGLDALPIRWVTPPATAGSAAPT